MSRITNLLVLCFCLSGCVLYSPSYNDQTTVVSYKSTSTTIEANTKTVSTSSTVVKPKKKEVSKPVTPPIVSQPNRPVVAECDSWTLPTATPVPPKPTPDQLASATTPDQLDMMIGEYIGKLQTYIDNERTKLEQAHESWLDRCRHK